MSPGFNKDVEKLTETASGEEAACVKKDTDADSHASLPIDLLSNHSSDSLPAKDEERSGEPIRRAVTAQDWTGPDDPENPHNWSVSKRSFHTAMTSLYGFAVYDLIPVAAPRIRY
jgi:hypothetical protein